MVVIKIIYINTFIQKTYSFVLYFDSIINCLEINNLKFQDLINVISISADLLIIMIFIIIIEKNDHPFKEVISILEQCFLNLSYFDHLITMGNSYYLFFIMLFILFLCLCCSSSYRCFLKHLIIFPFQAFIHLVLRKAFDYILNFHFCKTVSSFCINSQ